MQNDSRVTVMTEAGEKFHSRSVIVTVPLNCLNNIEFSPGLSATKQRVSAAGHTGSGTKVYARIQGRKPLVMCTGTHDMPLKLLWTEYDD